MNECCKMNGYRALEKGEADDLFPESKETRASSGRSPTWSLSKQVSLFRVATALFCISTLVYISNSWSLVTCRRLDVVDQVLRDVPLIDGHNDLPHVTRMLFGNHIYGDGFNNHSKLTDQVDFPRLRAGRLGGQFWSVYASCPEGTENAPGIDPFPSELYLDAQRETLQQIDLVKRMIAAFPDDLVSAVSSHEVWSNYRQSRTRVSSLMGIEGLHAIGNSPSALRLYHQLGVRYATLTHFCHNRYADSSNGSPYWNGISEDGKKIIKEMNRMGMIVDLAHTSPDTMRQALDLTDVPVMFSHASVYGICAHERNVPDDVLWKLKGNGGVIMITFVNEYVNCENPDNATLSDIADHIQYVGGLIGYGHVGIGSDFDGMPSVPRGLEDVSKYPALLEELARRGVTVDELKALVGANILRVLRAVEDASRQRARELPLEDNLPTETA